MTKTPLIMGILNVTPDSFSDGGKFVDHSVALKHVEQMIEQGADIIDVGGESTRPGASSVSAQEEIDRTVPVIEKIARHFDVAISIDTSKSAVASEAILAGASIVNDVTAGRDIEMAKLVAKQSVNIILMHMLGDPRTMQKNPEYPKGVVMEVKEYLIDRVKAFHEFGVSLERIWIDPGIGFGKTLEHNLKLLKHLNRFKDIAGQVVIGTSRKSFLSLVLGDTAASVEMREAGTIATNLWAYSKGASILRVHDVGAMKRALITWEGVRKGGLS